MTRRKRPSFITPTQWTTQQLDSDRRQSENVFRRERMEEPLEAYLDAFEDVQSAVEDVLESTVDLSQLEDQALTLLTDPALLYVFRYLAGPPISEDDLKTLVDTNSISPRTLRNDVGLVQRLVETIRSGLDRRSFPWVSEGREPTEAERQAAILASSALIATQRAATSRRNEGKSAQEEKVREELRRIGLVEISIVGRAVASLAEAPQPGLFVAMRLL